ncbi:hypothetical protein [Micromonospora maritima]|uniref:hypothetical protein n=1 Tax=Micromonospora maritima TaxID=986711 RepID=UPI00157C26FD|nr:hypothetical protein [Micromonospora maritima]
MSQTEISRRAVAYISIGNSDDELPQREWADFARRVEQAIGIAASYRGGHIHGNWHSKPTDPWQNACWALQLPVDLDAISRLRADLIRLAGEYRQDSIAWALADTTTFLRPEKA